MMALLNVCVQFCPFGSSLNRSLNIFKGNQMTLSTQTLYLLLNTADVYEYHLFITLS